MPTSLTTVANFKSWLGISNTDPARDANIARLILTQSRFIETWLSRTILSQRYTEARDGGGMGRSRYMMYFMNEPVSTVQSLTVNGLSIPPSPDNGVQQAGYGFDDTQLWLAPVGPYIDRLSSTSYEFSRGFRNIIVQYTAGFLVLPYGAYSDSAWLLPAEVQTVPSLPASQLTTSLLWLADNQVNYADTGVQLTAVPANPQAGQYSVAAGVYTFAGADVGRPMALSYSYVPSDIEQACIELAALRWKERERIGLVSQAVGTESTSYFQRDMPADVATVLAQYRRVYDHA